MSLKLLLTLFGSAGLLGILIIPLLSLRSRFKSTSAALSTVETEAFNLRIQLMQRQKEDQLLADFLREFPQAAGELHSRVSTRRLPSVLLQLVLRTFNPWQAVVLLRRRPMSSDPTRHTRWVAAAVARPDSRTRPGMEVATEDGALGLVAESQQIVSRADLERDSGRALMKSKPPSDLGFEPDLIGPMVIGGETVGLIVLAGTPQVSETGKGVLRIICQAGALAVHNTSTYNEVKLSAQMDGLTRVYNKTHITKILAEQICQAQDHQRPLSIFLFDIDHFKNYNDVNGHTAGDTLLRLMARLVEERVRRTDFFGRFGGEEFLLVLPETDAQQAQKAAEKIRSAISGHEFPFGDKQPLGSISVSGGVAAYPTDGLDSVSLLRAADQALYQSKAQGRNRVSMAAPQHCGGDGEIQGDPALLEKMLQNAIELGSLSGE